MSIEQAQMFLRIVRQEGSVIGAVGEECTLPDLVSLGRRSGLEFDADDLRQAFRNEWGMRWMFAHAGTKGG